MTVWDEQLSHTCRFPVKSLKSEDCCELLSPQTLRNSTPALSLHLPGATFEDMDPAAVVARMVDGENQVRFIRHVLRPDRLQDGADTTATFYHDRFRICADRMQVRFYAT
jgi:hypothetical protein